MEAVSNGNQLITHFKSTIMKGTEAFKRTIGEYLQVRANTDEIFAQRMKKEGKTLDGCVDFILNTVKESGCNGFEDDEIYGMAVHYYDEDEIAEKIFDWWISGKSYSKWYADKYLQLKLDLR